MKKILLVCDTDNFPKGAFDFIKTLHEQEPLLLVGIFFHSVNNDVFMPSVFLSGSAPAVAYSTKDVNAVKTSIDYFTVKCQRNNIEYRVHEEHDSYEVNDFIRETRFADLVVISEQLFFSHIDKKQPNSFLQKAIHKSECPLLLIPEKIKEIENVVLAYDGTKQSMYAIKQFCHLFPLYSKRSTTLLHLTSGKNMKLPDSDRITEYAPRHFSNLKIEMLDSENKDYLDGYLTGGNYPLLVTGAYSKSGLYYALHNSFAEAIISNHRIPVFIAHTF